jgi:hypothetical protein
MGWLVSLAQIAACCAGIGTNAPSDLRGFPVGTDCADAVRVTITQKTAAFLGTLLSLALALPGCTLIGLGIGSSFKKMDARPVVPQSVRCGDTVEIVSQDSMGTHVVAGTYEGCAGGELIVESETGIARIPVAQAQVLRIQTGTYWLEGMVPGVVVDTIVMTAAGISYANSSLQKPIVLHGIGQ